LRDVLGEAGEHAPASDPAAFAAALRRLTDDAARRGALGAAARAAVARYSIAASAASYVELYDEILASRDLS
jgi:glycosyltransferase involved in cell wall biosynthesis